MGRFSAIEAEDDLIDFTAETLSPTDTEVRELEVFSREETLAAQKSAGPTFDTLPYDVLYLVIGHLFFKDVCTLRMVSRRLAEVLNDRLIWMNLLRTHLTLYGLADSPVLWPGSQMTRPNIEELLRRPTRLLRRLNHCEPGPTLWHSSIYLAIPQLRINHGAGSRPHVVPRHVEHLAFLPGGRWLLVVTHTRPYEAIMLQISAARSTVRLFDLGDLIQFKHNAPVAEMEFVGKKVITFVADFPLGGDQSKVTLAFSLADTASIPSIVQGLSLTPPGPQTIATTATGSLDLEIHVINLTKVDQSDSSRLARRLRLPSAIRIKGMTMRESVLVVDLTTDIVVWNWAVDTIARISVDQPPLRDYPRRVPPPTLKLTEDHIFVANAFANGPQLRIWPIPPLLPRERDKDDRAEMHSIAIYDAEPIHTVKLPLGVSTMRFADPGSTSARREEAWHKTHCIDDACTCTFTMFVHLPNNRLYLSISIPRSGRLTGEATDPPNRRLWELDRVPTMPYTIAEADRSTFGCNPLWFGRVGSTATMSASTFASQTSNDSGVGRSSLSDVVLLQGHGSAAGAFVNAAPVHTPIIVPHSPVLLPWFETRLVLNDRMESVVTGFVRTAYPGVDGAPVQSTVVGARLDEFSGMAVVVEQDSITKDERVRVMVCDGRD